MVVFACFTACQDNRAGVPGRSTQMAQKTSPPPTTSEAIPVPRLDVPKVQPELIEGLEVLGRAPFCEASAAIPSPWHPGRMLVADNEIQGELFTFALKDGRLSKQRVLETASKSRPRDVEALAYIDDTLLVFGSHSRNYRCEVKPKRRRIRVLRYNAEDDELEHVRLIDSHPKWAASTATTKACLKAFFTQSSPLAKRFCAELVRSEATPAHDGEKACPTINIEGAFVLEDRVWIGLRSPLLSSQAVLLRLEPTLTALRFDAIATADLGKRGIRELALHNTTLYAIGGPRLDAPGRPFQLYTLDVSGLVDGQVVSATHVTELPSSSEGLAFDGSFITALIDGAEGETDSACESPSLQMRFEP